AYAERVIAPSLTVQTIPTPHYPYNLNVGQIARSILLTWTETAEDSLGATIASIASQAGLLGLAFVLSWQNREDRLDFALWLIAVTMCSPIVWKHFLTCFIIAYVALAERFPARHVVVAAVTSFALATLFGEFPGYPLQSISSIWGIGNLHLTGSFFAVLSVLL